MKKSAFLLLSSACGVVVFAAPRTSSDYSIPAEIIDSGGQRSTSADYSALGSFTSPAGISATPGAVPDYAAFHGFLSQLNDGTLPAAFIAWQTLEFGDPGDPAAAPLADDEKDGVDNIAEFGFGLDPDLPTAGTLGGGNRGLPVYQREPVPGLEGVHTTIEFIRRTDAAVDYQIQTSPDMENWSLATVVQVGGAIPAGDGFEQVKFAEVPPAAGERRYLGILLTLQGP